MKQEANNFKHIMKTSLIKWLLVLLGGTGCLIAANFILAGWQEYQAKQEYLVAAEMISSGRDQDRGLAILEEIRPVLSEDTMFLEEYGKILNRLGKKEEAIEVYETALRAGHFPSILERLSSLYLDTGRSDKAIECAREALLILPWKLEPRFLLAAAFQAQGNIEEAFTYSLETVLTPMKVPSNKGMNFKRRAREILSRCAPRLFQPGEEIQEILNGLDVETAERLRVALAIAGENRVELEKALLEASPAQLESLLFLLANMPESDLRALDSHYLLDNIDAALEARNLWPFMADIPEDVFLNYLLPYAQAGEERDHWRRDLMARFLPVVEDCKSPGEIALSVQIEIVTRFGIQFDNEGLGESYWSVGDTISNQMANCISLSILLADACRAVGVPARIVTIPSWKSSPGGHTWIEIYDQGEWRHTNAFELSPFNLTWFEELTAATDTSKFQHRIYGASFRRTDIQLLQYGPDTWWTDETGSYVETAEFPGPGETEE